MQSISGINQPMDKTAEMLLLSGITSAKLNPHCAYSVLGQLAKELSPERSAASKSTFLLLARRHHKDLKGLTDDAYQHVRQEIGAGLARIIDEIKENHLRGGMLGVMIAYRINLLKDIRARVDYSSLTSTAFLQDWQFNEYAACMGEEKAPERMATILARSDAPILRLIFTEIAANLSRGDNCLSHDVIRTLVEPYLNDSRVTHDVNGDGSPVSYYAHKVKTTL